jgi:Cu2+-exporting ATPase
MTAIASVVPPPAADPLALLDDPLEQRSFTRWTAGADGERIAESAFQLGGMHCAACSGIIESALAGVPGVLGVQVSGASQRAQVRWNPLHTRASALVEAVRRAGYDAVPDASAPARAMRRAESRRMLWRLFVAAFCSMQVMMLATPAYVAGAGELAPDLKRLLDWGGFVLTLPVMAFSATPLFAGAWAALRRRRIAMELPVALGLAVGFVASSAATFDPAGVFGGDVYFDSLSMFVAFLLGARWLEMRARHRAAASLESALARLPEQAMRVRADGATETVSVLRLAAGDRVRVPVGQAFPADGVQLQGATQADEALLSGESRPVDKSVGSTLVAGSVNLGAPVEMRVDRVGDDTRYAAIVALVRDALAQRPAMARSADRWAGPFLAVVLALAVLAPAYWLWVDPARALPVAVAILIVTCPCALSLAAPSALLAAAGRLARRGVLVQRLDALEPLARLQQLFIDKTGTLTGERMQLRTPDPAAARVLGAAASLASWSRHPLAQALAGTCPSSDSRRWHAVEEVPGHGLRASDAEGLEWRLGSASWVGAPDTGSDAPQVWFGHAGERAVRFEFDETLRDDAAPALGRMSARGVEVALLSGDSPARVARLAARLGLARAVGGATPEDKLAALRAAQRSGRVVGMVGDGVNDAPVLAQADVSFAMGQGALVARANADAVVLSMRISDVAEAHALARRTRRVVQQNLVWAALYNAACVPLAAIGWLPPWAAGLGMAASSLVVIGNSLRLTR